MKFRNYSLWFTLGTVLAVVSLVHDVKRVNCGAKKYITFYIFKIFPRFKTDEKLKAPKGVLALCKFIHRYAKGVGIAVL